MPHDDFWIWLHSDSGRAAIAGAAGGIVRWLTLRERPVEGLASLVVGALSAIYAGPLVVPILEPVIGGISPGGDAAGFSAFIVGVAGISLSSFVIEVMQARRRSLRSGDGDEG